MNIPKRLLLALAVALGLFEPAAAEKIYRVGFLGVRSRSDRYYEVWVRTMRSLGYVEGKNLAVEWRFADGKYDRLPDLAKELGALHLDVIVTHTLPATRELKTATSTTPIVFAAILDPVGNGVVSSLARPGGNVTGISLMTTDISPKRIELLKELTPTLTKAAVLVNRANIGSHILVLKKTQEVAPALGVEVRSIEIKAFDEFASQLANAGSERVQALIVPDDGMFNGHLGEIAKSVLQYRMSSIGSTMEYAEAGGLAAYGTNLFDPYRRAAELVDKILKGTKPADLPVEQPTKLELVVNRRTANALGLEIPPELLVQADRVIE